LIYRGPHTDDCLYSLWLRAGCVNEGYDNPRNLSVAQKRKFMKMNVE